MGYHVLAYQTSGFGVSNQDMSPVADAIFSIQNGHFLPHVDLNVYGAYFGGANLLAVRLVTPRSRQIVPPPLYPIQGALLPPDRPHIVDRRNNPFKLNAVEEVSLQANLGGAGSLPNVAVLFAGTSLDMVPAGDIYSLHGTSTTAAVPMQWTPINITWDQTIPAGNYTMIASQQQSTNAIAHRWVFKTAVMRPGFLSVTAIPNISEPSWYYGGWGILGTFNTYTYPQMEVLCNVADTAHDCVMNIIKVG